MSSFPAAEKQRIDWFYRSLVVLALAISFATAGCFRPNPETGLACTPAGDCPPNQQCIGGVCLAENDQSPVPFVCEDGVECTAVCGDVNQDGVFDAVDASDLLRVAAGDVLPCKCANSDADIDSNGALDGVDAVLAEATVNGDVTAPCGACDAACGDVDGNGAVESDDSTLIAAIVAGVVPTACSFAAGDVDRDARITRYDADLIQIFIQGRVPSLCESCSAGVCGDANGDSTVDTKDINAVSQVAAAESTQICEFIAADIDNSAAVDSADIELVRALIFPTVDPTCEICSGVCGDVNGDSIIDQLDETALEQFLSSSETPTVCEYDAGNTRFDSLLNIRDTNLLAQIRQGNVAGGCEECTGICGDVDQDGAVTSFDAIEAEAIRKGTQDIVTGCAFDAADLNANGIIDISEPMDIEAAAMNASNLSCTSF